uniref:Uncharacterized protein n=1 Tax=Avena sativa TaxID=4498 RepID=A0ACD5YMC8_AVESA
MFDPYTKTSSGKENDRIKYAASCMKGARLGMEDYHTAILELDGSDSTSFFGVFDGHGGHKVALYCSKQFHIELVNHPDYENDPRTAMKHVYFRIDETLRRSEKWKNFDSPPDPYTDPVKGNLLSRLKTAVSQIFKKYKGPQQEGTTACVALIRGNQIIVGNVGDSRCVLSRNGQAIDLSTDHKPNDPRERDRIEAAGGKVFQRDIPKFESGRRHGTVPGIHRVDGIIATSRALELFLTPARQRVTCNPDIRTENITDDTDFLLIASDGIWQVKTSEEVVSYVNKRLQSGTDPIVVCERLLDWCMLSLDNSTVILVQFKRDGGSCPEPSCRLSGANNPTATDIRSSHSCPRSQAKTTDTPSTSGGSKADTKSVFDYDEE